MPTTTTLPPCVLANVVEDDLVCMLQRAINSTAVYHFQVFRTLDAKSAFPCIVYERTADPQIDPEMDDGTSGFWSAAFDVYVACINDGDTLRDWATRITNLTGPYGVSGWVTATDDTEQYEPPIELQEDGVMQTRIQVTIDREGK